MITSSSGAPDMKKAFLLLAAALVVFGASHISFAQEGDDSTLPVVETVPVVDADEAEEAADEAEEAAEEAADEAEEAADEAADEAEEAADEAADEAKEEEAGE